MSRPLKSEEIERLQRKLERVERELSVCQPDEWADLLEERERLRKMLGEVKR